MGRITQRPLATVTQQRGPRPDDPIPRKPPAFFIKDRSLKRVASTGAGSVKKQKLNSSGIAADLGSGVRLDADVFKVPELPKKSSIKAKGKEKEKDVFGDISEVVKVKPKAVEDEAALEKANKNVNIFPRFVARFLKECIGCQASRYRILGQN